MHRLLLTTLVMLGLPCAGLAGCRSNAQTVNPFLGRSTVPAQPTGAIGQGANTAPYYQNGAPPPGSAMPGTPLQGAPLPGQPGGAPPAGNFNAPPYNGAPYNGAPYSSQPQRTGWQFTGTAPNLRVTGDVVDLDSQLGTPTKQAVRVDSQVQPAAFVSTATKDFTESAVRIPTDSSPLVTQRVVSAPVTLSAPQPFVASPAPVDSRQPFTQTLLPAQQSNAPISMAYPGLGSTLPAQGVPANLVYGSGTPMPVTQPQVQPVSMALSPIPDARNAQYVTNIRTSPQLAGPTLATAQTAWPTASTRTVASAPAMEITDLPPVQRTTQRLVSPPTGAP